MTIATPLQFIQILSASRILRSSDLQTAQGLAEQYEDSRELARELVRRNLLTRWQAQQLLAGRHKLHLGKYKLLDKLGEGGMGAVYKAEQSGLGRLVAIKVMSQDVLKDEAAAGRFHREIRSVAALNHPNIIAALDANQEGQLHFLVMEYVQGRDLKAWIDEYGRLPVDWACECIRQAALGLQHAHEKGLVHRDIKPGNLLVVGNDTDNLPHIKILDMGLARFTSEAQCTQITKTGQVLGTIDYISPEQARDTKGADIRADIYSLGCTLFRMLSGEVPFKGENPVEKLMARAMADAPLVRTLRPDLPPELERIIAKMLARKPDDRYQTPLEVAEALAPFAAGTAGASEASSNLHLPASDPTVRTPGSTIEAEADATLHQFLQGLVDESAAETLAPPAEPEPPKSSDSSRSRKAAPVAEEKPEEPIKPAGTPERKGIPLQFMIGGGLAALAVIGAIIVFGMGSGGGGVAQQGGPNTPKPTKPPVSAVEPKTTAKLPAQTRPIPPDQPSGPPPNYALEFDGTDDYVEIPSLALAKGESRTVELWISHCGPTPRQRLFDLLGDGATLSLDYVPASSIWHVFGKPTTSGNTGFYSAVEAISNSPAHLAVQFDLQSVHPRMFVNGKPLDGPKKGFGFGTPTRSGAVLGGSSPNAKGVRESFFQGRLHQVRVSRSLRYSRAFTPPERFEKDADTLALYRLDEGTGDVLKDSSGNGHDGKIVGARWVKDEPPSPAPSYALQFDGKTSYVEIPDLSRDEATDLTVEAWIRPAVADVDVVVRIEGKAATQLYRTTGKWAVGMNAGGTTTTNFETPFGAQIPGVATHVAHVIQSGKSTLFVGGKPVARTGVLSGAHPTSPFRGTWLGAQRRAEGVRHFFSGVLDEVHISKTARYTQEFTPAPRFSLDQDTLAIYHCDEGAGDVLRDSSPHGRHGRITGAKWVSGLFEAIPRDVVPNKAPAESKLAARLRTTFPASATHHIALSPDGKRLADRSRAINKIRLWDVESAKVTQTWSTTVDSHRALAFSSPEVIASGEGPNLFLLMLDGSKFPAGKPHVDMISSLAVSKNRRVATCGAKGDASVKLEMGGALQEIGKHGVPPGAYAVCVAFSADGTLLASGGSDSKVRVFDVTTGKQKFELDGGSIVHAVAFSPDGRYLASGDRYKATPENNSGIGRVKLWDVSTGQFIKSFEGFQHIVNSVAFSPDSRLLAAAHEFGRGPLRVFDLVAGGEPLSIPEAPASSIAFLPVGHALVAGGEKSGIQIWDIDVPAAANFTNALGMEFVRVPAGKSWLGGGGGKPGTQAVEFAEDFYLGKFEVTQEEWQKVMGANPSSFTVGHKTMPTATKETLKRFPVETVSWDDAQGFVKKLNEQTREVGWVYRLPTEQEWEYACRGGPMTDAAKSGFDFYLNQPTNTVPPAQVNSQSEGYKRTTNVGPFPANGLGLHDMHGNVWEWCDDVVVDHKGDSARANRGGSWSTPLSNCRVAYRNISAPAFKNDSIGLRVARVRAADTKPTAFTNSLGMEFVRVPAGKSWLGGGGGKPGTKPVEFAEDFYLGKFEVTQGEWAKVMNGSRPSYFRRDAQGADLIKNLTDADVDRLPVEAVSWDQMQVFLRQLNEQTRETGWTYRLPKADEWEYAARGGPLSDPAASGFDFYFDQPRNTLLPELANAAVDHRKLLNRTSPVGLYPPNPLGLHDLFGNVREWCLDEEQHAGDKTWRRAVRGGGWNIQPDICRAARHDLAKPGERLNNLGLRLARVPAAVWQPLLNGKDLAGWRQMNPNDTGKAETRLEDGCAILQLTPPAGRTVVDLKNYHLRFEYKAEKGAGGGVHQLGGVGDLSFRLHQLTWANPVTSLAGAAASFEEAEIRGGTIVGTGRKLQPGEPLLLKNMMLDAGSPWQRLDILRIGDACVYLFNGRVACAITGIRGHRVGDRPFDKHGVTFWTDNFPATFRNIEVREITTWPAEVVAGIPHPVDAGKEAAPSE